jgi:hypothetical protein
MSLDRVVEEIIRDAMARGEFDDLPGQGKPLDLDAYFAAPEDLRLAYSMLKNAGYLPQEAELLRQMGQLRAQLDACGDEMERSRITREIDDRLLRFSLLNERYRAGRRARR